MAEDFLHFFADDAIQWLEDREEEPPDARVRWIDRIVGPESIAPMLERMERLAPSDGDITAFFKSFPCAPHGEGKEAVDPWQRGFTCVVPKRGNVGALPDEARAWNFIDSTQLNQDADFLLDQGRFVTCPSEERLEKTNCDIKLRKGVRSELPRLAVKKYQLRLLDGKPFVGKFQLYHVRDGKDSSRSVKTRGARSSSSRGDGVASGSSSGDGGSPPAPCPHCGASGGGWLCYQCWLKAGSKRGRQEAPVEGSDDTARGGCGPDDKTPAGA